MLVLGLGGGVEGGGGHIGEGGKDGFKMHFSRKSQESCTYTMSTS